MVVAILALGVSACGGDDEVPAAEQWAGDLCASVNTWRDAISSATESVTSNPSRDGLEAAADDVRSATETLVDDLRDLGAPDTEAGDEARAAADELAESVEESRETVEDAVDDVSGTSGVLEAVSTVSQTISQMSTQLSQTLDELSSLGGVDDELRQGFADAEACEGIAGGS